MIRWSTALGLVCACLSPAIAADPAAKPSPEAIEFFEKKVRPVLADMCYSCHGEKKQSAGLRLDTAAGMKAGADNGPVVVPGAPEKSRLIAAIRRLFSGAPGTTTGPLSAPAFMPAAVSSRSPALCFFSPWHE